MMNSIASIIRRCWQGIAPDCNIEADESREYQIECAAEAVLDQNLTLICYNAEEKQLVAEFRQRSSEARKAIAMTALANYF